MSLLIYPGKLSGDTLRCFVQVYAGEIPAGYRVQRRIKESGVEYIYLTPHKPRHFVRSLFLDILNIVLAHLGKDEENHLCKG